MNTVRITIPFYDKPLVLIDHNERPFVAMRPIVEGMGMDWAGQQRKLKDRFASTVDILSTVADDGRKRAMLCLPLQQLPAWLNTIHPEKVAAPLSATTSAATSGNVTRCCGNTGRRARHDGRTSARHWRNWRKKSRHPVNAAAKRGGTCDCAAWKKKTCACAWQH